MLKITYLSNTKIIVMKNYLFLLLSTVICQLSTAQNVGIGTTTPNSTALLHVDVGTSRTNGLLVTGTFYNPSTVPDLGAGTRMMFYPGKAAFRAGSVDDFRSTSWNNSNVGFLSSAMGYSTIASGYASTAMGNYTTASGGNSTAMGYNTTANGGSSTAMGSNTTASANTSTAMGNSTTASGFSSTAMGYSTIASGYASTAMGYNTTASGINSTAMGNTTIASGDNSFAAGARVSTNGHAGAFFFGDGDPFNKGVRSIGFNDQFAARFNGGYYFISSDVGADIGVQVLAGGNAWVSMCDKNRKENFEPLNGDDILQKLKSIQFSSWNYKTQNPKVHRHYGIMAQDFFHAFGSDKYGTIGNDTTVNPIDMIGIDMAAIQALEKRTAKLNEELKTQKARYAERLEKSENQIAELTRQNEDLAKRLQQLEAFMLRQNKEITVIKN